jgi:hypothetical protein
VRGLIRTGDAGDALTGICFGGDLRFDQEAHGIGLAIQVIGFKRGRQCGDRR